MALPPPTNITRLQSLQEKENLLHHFVCNYAEKTHGFMQFLKKGIPFVWDDLVQHSFDNLLHAFMHAPLLQPLDYTKDCFLFADEFITTIGMVLVQEENNDQEHVIYYLSKSLLDSET